MRLRRSFRVIGVALVLIAVAALPAPFPPGAAADEASFPEDQGPHGWTKITKKAYVGIDERGHEGTVPFMVTDVYLPTNTALRPVVVFSHGLCDTKLNYTNWGPILASRGFVAVVPNRRTAVEGLVPPNEATVSECLAHDPRINSEDLLRMLRWAKDQSADPDSELHRKIDIRRSAIVGHSLGGTFAALAAARASNPEYFGDSSPEDYSDIRLRAVVVLDPGRILVEPQQWRPEFAATKIGTPTAVIAAQQEAPPPDPERPKPTDIFQPVLCEDAQRPHCLLAPRAMFSALPAGLPRLGLEVLGATHFAPADPPADEPDPERQRWFKRYALAWLAVWLGCDPDAMPYLNGSAAHSDEQQERISLFAASSSFPAGKFPDTAGC